MRAERPRVLLTDADARWAAAACRGLSIGGYRVSGAARARPAATHWSRHCDERLVLPDPAIDDGGFVAALRGAIERGGYDVLLPAAELSLRVISEHRERLPEETLTGLPPHEVVVRSLDKPAVVPAAERAGIGPPRSVLCPDIAATIESAESLGFPMMLKPERSLLRDADLGWRGQPSVLVRDADELRAATQEVGFPLLSQRYEPESAVLSFAGVVSDDGLIGTVVSRYVRTWPSDAGSASFSFTIEPDPDLVTAVETFVLDVGWRGIFELEILRRPDGTFAMIDFNPRLYGSVALAIAAGANLPAVWCDRLLGRPVEPVVAASGWSYRSEPGEAKNLVERLRHGDLAGAWEVARPKRRVAYALFTASDPGPLLAHIVQTRKQRHLRSRGGRAPTVGMAAAPTRGEGP